MYAEMKKGIKSSRGFTLIELAIVLVIVGLLVGMGASLLGPLTQRAKLQETREIIDAATESIISYAASRNEIPASASFSSTVRKSTDVWSNSLLYALDANLTNSAIGGICGRKTTGLTVNICPNAACTSPDTRSNVAFLILSRGENINIQTNTTSSTINVYDVGVVIDNYSGGGDPSNAVAYDDVYKWISLDELRIKTGCTGAPLKVLNNELPSGKELSAYSADIYADGGVTFSDGGDTGSEADYEWCWEDDPVKTSPGGMTFTCNGALSTSASCSLTGGTWRQCTSLTLGGTPAGGSNNTYMFTFYVRDNNDTSGTNDNIAQKSLVLTVSP